MKSLVVDDDFVALTKTLAVLKPYGSCHAATNGPQAIQMFAEALAQGHPYELIVLDIQMPCVDGLEVLRTIRQREGLRRIKPAQVIILSANSSRDNVREAAQRQCDTFLVKPVSRNALMAALERLGISPPCGATESA